MCDKNNWKRFKERWRPRWVKSFRQLLQSRLRLRRVATELGLHAVASNPLKQHKTSDTLFILGSGSSINSISPDEWAVIEQADSLGFNYWPIHDHVPTLYVAEICAVPAGQEENYRRYCDLMQVRAGDYAKIPIVIKDGERVKSEWLREYILNFPESLRQNISLTWDWEIPDDDDDGLAESLLRWDRWGLLEKDWAPCLRKRASVFFLVLLAVRAGYRQIVLCGVDLDNNEYFYRLREAEFSGKGRPVPQPAPVHVDSGVHKTDNLQYGQMPISKAIEVLDRCILKPKGIRLSVGLQSSKLYPMLPAFFGR